VQVQQEHKEGGLNFYNFLISLNILSNNLARGQHGQWSRDAEYGCNLVRFTMPNLQPNQLQHCIPLHIHINATYQQRMMLLHQVVAHLADLCFAAQC
jgi:hypothetical protein